MHPRAYSRTPYLEDEWWDAVGVCVWGVQETEVCSLALHDEYAIAAAPQVVHL